MASKGSKKSSSMQRPPAGLRWAKILPYQRDPLSELAKPLQCGSHSHASHSPKLAGLQAKLVVGLADDEYEKEADRVSEQVASMPEKPAQRQGEEKEKLQTAPEGLGSKGGPAGPELEQSLEQARAGGRPLAERFRGRMENAFGADFSLVRIHADEPADRLSRSIQARAFTRGQDIFLRQGEYQPASAEGQRLLAHELTHVVQQNGGAVHRVQMQATGRVLQAKEEAPPNRTGMPDHLKSGLEDLSGERVHYSSSKPAKLNALAYTQGQDIEIGPRQERHLPHEFWHVYPQMHGRVKPKLQDKGVLINDDAPMEREAEVIGAKALQITRSDQVATLSTLLQRRKTATSPYQVPSVAPSPLITVVQRNGKKKRDERGLSRKHQENFDRMKNQKPEVSVVESEGVMTLSLYDGLIDKDRNFSFSLSRHWFPWLDGEAKPLNSVMHYDLRDREIEKDSIDIGRSLIGLWKETSGEPSSLRFTTSAGREYLLDVTGSSIWLNHYFVISGPKVAGQVNQNEYMFYRQLSKYDNEDANLNEVKKLYGNVNLTADEVRLVSGIDIHSDLGIPTPEQIANQNHFLNCLEEYLTKKNKDVLPFKLLNKTTWEEKDMGQAIFNKSYAEMSEAYDSLYSSHKLSTSDRGVKPKLYPPTSF